MQLFMGVIKHSIMITGFIFVMMLLIEYIDVQTKGLWQKNIKEKKFMQYLIAAILGAIPGCLGAFTVVTMFSHNILSLGALVTAMIATSGDEAFIMFGMIPKTALIVTMIIFVIGIVSGIVTDKFFPKKWIRKFSNNKKLPLHKVDSCVCFQKGLFISNLKNITLARTSIMLITILLLYSFISGIIGPQKWNWVRISLLLTTSFSLFISATVPEHFLEEHLWNHIVKVHIPKIFIYTFVVLLAIQFLDNYMDIKELITDNLYIVLVIAVLVGIIPQSGPHMIFLTLFVSGTIPISILIANSIVQDGHGMLPLLAESKHDFLYVKAINVIIGLAFGLIGLLIGF